MTTTPTTTTTRYASGTWTNWYANLSCEATIVDADSEEAVIDAVRFAKARGLTVRVAGTGHSNIALIPNDGMVIRTDRLQGLLAHDTAAVTATLAAGTKIRAMGDLLWEHGLSLTNQGDIDTQAIAGALATGTHGTGIGLQNLSSRIRSMRVVDANGDPRVIDGTDEHRLLAARVSMGMLGVVTEVELDVSPAYSLHEWVGLMPYDEVVPLEDAYNARFRHFTYFHSADAKSGAHMLALSQDEVPDAENLAVVRIFDPEPIDVPELERYTFRRRHDRSYRIFPEDYPPEFDEMEYMVPLEVGRACFEEINDRFHDEFARHGNPSEVRFTAGDDAYLSEYYGGPRRAISLAAPMGADNTEFFRRVDAVFEQYEGRPHWAKANNMTRERLRGLYPRFDDFVAVRRELDPDGRFLNDYLRRWFA